MAKSEKQQVGFEDFMAAVHPGTAPLVTALDETMRGGGCEVGIEPAKNGYVASYRHAKGGRVLANFVFRKKGLVVRLYADNIMQYMELLQALPEPMRAKIAGAPPCRRLINPDLCNPNCPKGYEFLLDGEGHQKCRYNCFMFFLDEGTHPYVERLVQRELALRNA